MILALISISRKEGNQEYLRTLHKVSQFNIAYRLGRLALYHIPPLKIPCHGRLLKSDSFPL